MSVKSISCALSINNNKYIIIVLHSLWPPSKKINLYASILIENMQTTIYFYLCLVFARLVRPYIDWFLFSFSVFIDPIVAPALIEIKIDMQRTTECIGTDTLEATRITYKNEWLSRNSSIGLLLHRLISMNCLIFIYRLSLQFVCAAVSLAMQQTLCLYSRQTTVETIT